MKLFLGFLFLVFSLCTLGPAHAGFQGFENGASLGLFNKVDCQTGVTCSKVNGKFQLTAAAGQRSVVVATTTTLTSSQCGSVVISDNADVVTLPEASSVPGCEFHFVCGTNDDFGINPNDGTDQIRTFDITNAGSSATVAPAAGDAIQCTDIGSTLILVAGTDDEWFVMGVASGLWADIN